MTIIITENQHKRIKIVNLTDLNDLGTWSPDVVTHKEEGKNLYSYKDDVFTKIERKNERSPLNKFSNNKDIFFLFDEQAEEANKLIKHFRYLERRAKEVRQQAKDVVGVDFNLPQKR